MGAVQKLCGTTLKEVLLNIPRLSSEKPQKVGAGGLERSLAGVLGVPYHPLNLGVLLTLFQPEGADYVNHITAKIWI